MAAFMPKDIIGRWLLPLTMSLAVAPGEAAGSQTGPTLRITVLFNNVARDPGPTPGWGFSCLLEGLENTILFDTGADGEILLDNMRRLDADPKGVDVVFLSHIHGDHTGGLAEYLATNPQVLVIVPAAFPASFMQAVTDRGARITIVGAGNELMTGVYSTGQFVDGIVEQALIVETRDGLVVITGCAHPGIARIADSASRLTGRKVHLLMGGFHLGGTGNSEIASTIERLRAQGVEKVAPSHCTGGSATAMFRQAWGENFVEGGLGAIIAVPLG
jgi:7,8-dihydropterin-6-yl-methyl-4-(beta-D-ribofuranosyl)aminobenzene 5'-phosphate synthase